MKLIMYIISFISLVAYPLPPVFSLKIWAHFVINIRKERFQVKEPFLLCR